MAFLRRDFSRVGHQAFAPAMWSYISADDLQAAIAGASYFDPAASELSVGDWLFITDSAGVHTISFVKSITSGVVVIASGTAIGDV